MILRAVRGVYGVHVVYVIASKDQNAGFECALATDAAPQPNGWRNLDFGSRRRDQGENEMCKGISQADLASFSELAAGGIPLDDEVIGGLKASGGGLSIYQSLTFFESYVTDLEFGGTGYVLSLEIYNASDRIVWPCAYRLTPLANEREFRWLEIPSPRVEGEPPYQFPRETSGGFGDAEVLNHRRGRKYRLYPGDSLEGYLLGAGQQPLLPEYRKGQLLDVTLSIFDQRDVRYEANVQLVVDRKPQVKQHTSKRNRPSLRDLFREARERESRQLREVA